MVRNLYLQIVNFTSTPRWVIFLFDILICALSMFFAYLLRFNMDLELVLGRNIILPISLATLLNLVLFEYFQTYRGIIRLSSSKEGIRVVTAVFYSCSALLLLTSLTAILGKPHLIPISILIIYFFTASFLIFAYRFWIKQLYHNLVGGKEKNQNVFLYGNTVNGLILKKAIESLEGRRYNVIGFIDANKNLWGKSIDNARIFSPKQAKFSMIRHKVSLVFLASEALDVDIKDEIVDFCLTKNILVKIIPKIDNWIDGRLHTKLLRPLRIEDLLNRPSIKLEQTHVAEYLNDKTALVTGAAGSIGSEIVKQLIALNIRSIILCDNRETGLYELQNQLKSLYGERDNIIISVSDVRSIDRMHNIFETYRPDIVFHAAAYKHVPMMEMNPSEAVKNNVLGTRNVAELSVAYNVKRFVLISTDKAVNPTNVMGATKRIAEMYISELQEHQNVRKAALCDKYRNRSEDFRSKRGAGTKFITTRFGNVLGSNGSVIPLFQEQIQKGGPVTVTHPDIVRYFMTIQEACSLVLEAGTMGKGGEVFVFDMGEPVRIADLANKMIHLEGYVPGKDIQVKFTGLRPGEKLYEELLNKTEEVIPTHHKKIMISNVCKAHVRDMNTNIEYLICLAKEQSSTLLVKQMKVIVPEYKSQNSVYKQLDTTDEATKLEMHHV